MVFVGVTNAMKMKVAKMFAQIVCYVHRGGAVPLDELKGRSSYP
jgi:hypothetical protein